MFNVHVRTANGGGSVGIAREPVVASRWWRSRRSRSVGEVSLVSTTAPERRSCRSTEGCRPAAMQLMARGGGSGSMREDGAEGGAVGEEDERPWRREAEAVDDERSEWCGGNGILCDGSRFCPIRDVLLF
nr:hypothetical protein Itr_chr12CG20240 [Ipomoea trifida]